MSVLPKNNTINVTVSISLESLRMRSIACVIDTAAALIFARAHVLNRTWLDSILQRDMPDIRSVPSKKHDSAWHYCRQIFK